jgi:dTDP-4-dehydrorhamnose reductase
MRVFVLGHKGMLGHMVAKYLRSQGVDVDVTSRRFPDWNYEMFERADYVVNCIGAIPQRTNNFTINYELPQWLSKLDTKVIHPGTDCEMDDDEYGASKRKAAEYILNNSTNTKILKTSIIGPELKGKASLLEWFLSQEGSVKGYTEAIWNGNTTLQWAKQCLHMMTNWDQYNQLTILEGECLSKYEMLLIFKSVFGRKNIITPHKLGKNKCLKGSIYTPSLKQQMQELKQYYYD